MPEQPNVLALYDCRSKQEYIYRTNRIQEITGGSALLADLFRNFFHEQNPDFRIRGDWMHTETPADFLAAFRQSGLDAEVIYEGGGNLCAVFKDRDTFIRANKKLSRQALDDAFSVSIIASCVDVTGDFAEDRRKLYEANRKQKNIGLYTVPCNVLPFTQVDRLTYQPIVSKQGGRQYTSESLRKKKKYDRLPVPDAEHQALLLDDMTDKGTDSILAIIYIDGNQMGEKVKQATNDGENPIQDYSRAIRSLRAFSKKNNEDFVDKPLDAIHKMLYQHYQTDEKYAYYYKYRKVIGGGDEITLICNAHAVPMILETYFEMLKKSGNSACAGVTLFHSHAPFADMYEIAEQCCEMGKKQSHLPGNSSRNYIDFHYCHAGITNDLETIRDIQEGNHTEKPYEYETTWQSFLDIGRIASAANRSHIKALCEAVYRGDSYYKETLRMIQSRGKLLKLDENDRTVQNMLCDIASVYDLWFRRKEGAEHE